METYFWWLKFVIFCFGSLKHNLFIKPFSILYSLEFSYFFITFFFYPKMKNNFYKDKWNCEIVQAQFDCTIFLNSLLCIIFNLMEAYRLHFNVNVSEFSHVKKVKQYLICVKLSTFSILGMHFITAIVEFIKTIYYLFIICISKCCWIARKLWKAIISWNFE